MSNDTVRMNAFSTAVSGLKAQQSALEMIGNNIANLNAIGFKGGRMTFSEQLGQTMGVTYVPFSQGALQSTGVRTDLAMNGDAYFVLNGDGGNLFSRAGNFFFNKEGILVNPSGYEVQGWMKNSGLLRNSDSVLLGNIVMDQYMISEPISTTNIWLSGNLNANLSLETNVWTTQGALTVADVPVDAADVGTTGINTLDQIVTALVNGDEIGITGTDSSGNALTATFTYGTDGTTVDDLLTAINTAFAGSATAEMIDGKIVLTDDAGGDSGTTIALTSAKISLSSFSNSVVGNTPIVNNTMIVYDSLGNAHELAVEFKKLEDPVQWAISVSATGDEIFLNGDGTPDLDGPNGIATFSSATGLLESFLFDDGTTILHLDPNNGANTQDINLDANGKEHYLGLTLFSSVSTLSMREQNGRQAGTLNDYKIDTEGTILANFTNGDSIEIAQIAGAKFMNPSGLQFMIGHGLLSSNVISGKATIGKVNELGSEIKSGFLEMSNVDLADQFTKMIESQRAYQAAAKILTTIDEVMMETTRLKR